MKWGHAVRVRKGTILYAAGVLACGNVLLQVLGFVYRVVLSRFAGAEGLGVYRLVNSVYLVLNAGCLSGVTTACSRLSAACEARGESGRLGAVLQLAFRAFFALSAACAAVVLLCGGSIAANLLGDGRCARAFPYMLLCLTLTGVENIFKSLFIGLERVQYTACSEVGEQLIRIFAVSFLLYEYGSGDYGRIAMLIFAGMVCSEIFSALFLTRLFRRNMRHIRFTRPDKQLYGQFFGIAAPLSASALIGNMLGSAGAVLLPQRLMAAGLDYEQALSALGVISGMAMPLLLFPVAFVSSVCTALLPAVTAAQAVGEQARVRVLTGRAVTTVGLIGIPATAVLVPLAPQLSELFFRQPLTGGYAALLGAAAVATYYQMATGSLLNALGLQRWNVATAISAELCQLALLYRWCARPTFGIYGYLLAMFLTGVSAAAVNLAILHRRTAFRLKPFRRFGVPLLCGAAVYLWTRFFAQTFACRFDNTVTALAAALVSAIILYLLVLRLLGIRLGRYLAHRVENPAVLPLFLW